MMVFNAELAAKKLTHKFFARSFRERFRARCTRRRIGIFRARLNIHFDAGIPCKRLPHPLHRASGFADADTRRLFAKGKKEGGRSAA
jgi:hypothetical protein